MFSKFIIIRNLNSMAQICRVYKIEVPVLIRVLHGVPGCCKRYQSNYYEILRVSQDATQKEIRESFIKLSKEMHPDSGDKGNHTDFVKLNEAYSVLCKKNSRYYYDINLKHNITTNYNSDFQYNGPHNFYTANVNVAKRPSNKKLMKAIGLCIIFMIIGGIIQLVCIIMWSRHKRYKASKKMAEYEIQYKNNMEQRKQFLELAGYKANFPDK